MWEFEPFLWWNWKQSTTRGGAHHLNGRNGETVKLEAHFVYGRNSVGEKKKKKTYFFMTARKQFYRIKLNAFHRTEIITICPYIICPSLTDPKTQAWAVPTHICVLTFRPLRTGFLENRKECVFSEGGGGLTHLSWSVSPGWSVQHLSSPHYSSNDIFKSLKVIQFQIITTLSMK